MGVLFRGLGRLHQKEGRDPLMAAVWVAPEKVQGRKRPTRARSERPAMARGGRSDGSIPVRNLRRLILRRKQPRMRSLRLMPSALGEPPKAESRPAPG